MLKELNTNKLIVELQKVLILVLMEHAQRVRLLSVRLPSPVCLNPCFNGTCSKRVIFVRPYVITCYIVNFTLINVFVLIKCTCFYVEESAKVTNLSDIGKVRSEKMMSSCFVEVQHFKELKTAGEAL